MNDLVPVSEVRLCIDADDVDRISRFWVELLGYRIEHADHEDGWRHLEPSAPSFPPLTIQPVPEAKAGKNRLHLDIFVTEPGPWIERCLELGGTLLWRSDEPDDEFQVIADPEGNELCICTVTSLV
jgi:hypothetical protein